MRALAVLLLLLAEPPVPGGFVTVAEGVRLRARPSETARSLAVVDAPQALQVLEAADGWVRVRYGSFSGWLRPEGDGGEPGRAERPPAPDEDRLRSAVAALSGPATPRVFGPFDLYTDVAGAGAAVLPLLSSTAAGIPAVYTERYGVRPVATERRDAIVLFEKPSGYEALVAGDERLARTGSRGHARSGFAVLSLAEDGVDGTRGLLAHEVTHLLNRRALGSPLPPWLEEGLAEDLAMCRFGPDGRLVPDTVRVRVERTRQRTIDSGRVRVHEVRWRLGPLVTVTELSERARHHGLTPLATLLSRPQDAFVSKDGRAESYPMAALFIRFLLADGLPGSRGAFRGFLDGVAAGESPSHQRLLQALGAELPAVDESFRKWLGGLRVE